MQYVNDYQRRAKQTSVYVVWSHRGLNTRGVLQVTLRFGTSPRTDEEHLAVQNFLAAIKQLQSAVRVEE